MTDALFAMILEKNKEVKNAAVQFSIDSAKFLGEDFLENKIKDQRPYVHEILRASVRRFVRLNETNLQDLDSQIGKRIKIDASETRIKTEGIEVRKMVAIEPKLSHSETSPKLVLKSVLLFTEPSDSDIRSLNHAFTGFLSDSLVAGLFSFQSENITAAVELLRHLNPFGKTTALAFFQYIYVRLFDTTRSAVLETMETLIKQILNEGIKLKTFFASKVETTLVFHGLVRYFYTSNNPNINLVIQVLSQTCPAFLSQLFAGLLNRTDFQPKLFDLIEEAILTFKEKFQISKEFVISCNNLFQKYQRKVSRILNLSSFNLDPKLIEDDQEIKAILKLYEEDLLVGSFSSKQIDREDLAKENIAKSNLIRITILDSNVAQIARYTEITEQLSKSKNLFFHLNLQTKNDLIISIFNLIVAIKTSDNKNIKFEMRELLSGEELILFLRKCLRTFLKNNLENTFLNILLENISRISVSAENISKTAIFWEIERFFKLLTSKILANFENVDFEDIFYSSEVFLQNSSKSNQNFGTKLLNFLFSNLMKEKKQNFQEKLNDFGSKFLKDYLLEILKQENTNLSPELGMQIEHDEHLMELE